MSSSTFVITVNGVLRHPRTKALNLQGMHLYRALATTGRLALLGDEDQDGTEWFLRTNGLREHAYLITEEATDGPTPASRRLVQVARLRSKGYAIEAVIEPDPEVSAALLDAGIPVLTYLHPQYSTPSFRPDFDRTARPWDHLVSTVDYQIELRANDIVKDPDDD